MKTLMLIAVLMCMLLFQGSANAVVGVADDVPGRDLLFPFICDKADPAKLNTLWGIAETTGNESHAYVYVRNRQGILIYDEHKLFTPYDVVLDDCQSLISRLSDYGKSMLEITLGDRVYYAGYITSSGREENNRFIGWTHLYEAENGSIADFKPFQAEEGMENNFSEWGPFGAYPVTADELFPRYLIFNDNSETRNWWILLKGVSDAEYPIFITANTRLEGFICNEEEDCISVALSVPHRLNIINVEDVLAPFLGTAYPKAGYGMLSLITRTQNILTGEISQFTPNVSTFMWSYHKHFQETTDTSLADGKILFGPKRYSISLGGKLGNTYYDKFSGSGMTGAGRIIIQNGDASGKNRVSSAEIILNGKTIFGSNDINQKEFELEASVDIASKNELSVRIKGNISSNITVIVKGPGIIKTIQSSGAGMLPVDRIYQMEQ